jgi:DNA repair protein RadD
MKSLFEVWEPGDGTPRLRDYQTDVLDRARAEFAKGFLRGVIQGDTGSGKTVIAAEQTKRALGKGKRVLIIAHRRRLVDQMVGTLAKFKIHAGVIMEGRNRWGSPVQVASRDTLRAGAQLPPADLVIVDECHTSLSAEYAGILAHYERSFVTGYTATPVRPDGSTLGGYYQFIACTVPTSQLVADGHLMAVECYDPEAVGRKRKRGEKTTLSGDPVYHWRKFADGLPTVVFAPKVADSLALCERYNAAGIPAAHIDASTPEDERDRVLDDVAAGRLMVVCNVDVLTEGVDVPALACCQIVRGCQSLRLYKQAVGRIMRPHPGKGRAVLIDHSGAVHEFGLPHSDFVWTLDDADTLEKRAKKEAKEKAAVTCPQCQLVFSAGPSCPSCGYVMPRKKRKAAASLDGADGLLTKYDGDQHFDPVAETHERVWKRALYIGRAKGWSLKQCARYFKTRLKIMPWEGKVRFLPQKSKAAWSVNADEFLGDQLFRQEAH